MSHTTAKPRKLTLDGKVLCADCHSQMRNTGLRYYCPNTTVESGGKCPNRPLDAEELLRSVFTRMIERLAREEIVEDVVRDITRSTQENARIQHRIIDQAETAIAEATARNGAFPRPGEQDSRITALDVDTAGPTFQIIVAQEELDKLEFIGDETGLRRTLSDPHGNKLPGTCPGTPGPAHQGRERGQRPRDNPLQAPNARHRTAHGVNPHPNLYIWWQ